MFAQIQNVVSSRDLFSSNPCKDFWDSQQFSQGASGSQNSQQSSVELFSQSKCSQSQQQQQRIGTSYEWSSNSQQINEEEPVKYYMKYLSKPPLFSDQPRKDHDKPQSENFKEFIEAQKTKTLERDQRDLLDSFIGLLKDYTKEVQTAMKTFEACLGTSLATSDKNLEKITSVAEKSFIVVDELKDDFENRFNKLRKDLKENEELKSVISKKEQDLIKLDMEVQTQKKQIEEFKKRVDDAIKREEEYKQREVELLEKIKEAERLRQSVFRDTPPPSQHKDLPVLQENRGDSLDRCAVTSDTSFSRKDMVGNNPYILHTSLYPTPLDNDLGPKPCARNTPKITHKTTTTFQPSHFSKYYGGTQSNVEHIGTATGCHGSYPFSHAKQCSVIQTGNKLQSIPENNASNHPLVHDAFPSGSPTQSFTLTKNCSTERQTLSSSSFPLNAVSPTLQSSVHPKTPDDQPIRTAPSPANRLSVFTRDKWPKSSPIATVLPQIQVKQQTTSHCQALHQGKKQSEDPLGIFTFDLTSSPLLEDNGTVGQLDLDPLIKQEKIDQSPVEEKTLEPKKRKKKVMDKPIRKYGTRSRGRIEQSNNQEEIAPQVTPTIPRNLSSQSDNSFSKTLGGLKRRVYSTVVANNKKKCDIGIIASTKTDEADNMKDLKLPDINSQKQYVSKGISRSSFKRQKLEKRTLSLVGSSLFENIDEDVSINQITESIRKHAQKLKIKQKQ